MLVIGYHGHFFPGLVRKYAETCGFQCDRKMERVLFTIITALCFWYGVESNDEIEITESLSKRAVIKDRYIAVFKENCTEEDMNYVEAAMGQAVRDGFAGIGPVKNFSTLAHLKSGIMGIIFDGDEAAAEKVGVPVYELFNITSQVTI